MEIPGGDRCPCSWIIPGERQLSGFTKTWVYPIVASFPAVESLGFLLIFRLLFGDRCASHNVVWHDEHVSWWRAAWHAAINNCRWKRTSGLTVFHQSGHGQVLLSARYRNATAQVRTDDLARPHTSAHACRCRPSSYFGTYRTLIDAQSQLHSEGDMKFSSCMECGVLLAVSWPCVHVVLCEEEAKVRVWMLTACLARVLLVLLYRVSRPYNSLQWDENRTDQTRQ